MSTLRETLQEIVDEWGGKPSNSDSHELWLALNNALAQHPEQESPEPEGSDQVRYYPPTFMGVVVGFPSGDGHAQLYHFDRDGVAGEGVTGVDRLIVDALLTHAKNSLYGAPAVLPAPYPGRF